MQHDVHLKFSNASRMQTWGAWGRQTLFLKYCLKYCRTTSSVVSRREAIRNPSLDQNHRNCWMKLQRYLPKVRCEYEIPRAKYLL
jgi:hypothetical protein